jgi:hypothetical protein
LEVLEVTKKQLASKLSDLRVGTKTLERLLIFSVLVGKSSVAQEHSKGFDFFSFGRMEPFCLF